MGRNPFARPRTGEEIISGVHLLGSHRVNFFVIEEGRSLTLVDCGFDGHRHYLKAWLDRRGRKLSDVEAVLLTHGHADHVGFAERLRRQGVPVFLHHRDADFTMRDHMRLPPQRLRQGLWRPSALSLFGEAVVDGVFTQPVLQAPSLIAGPGRLDVPGRPAVVVIEVPGHSAGSVAFHIPERNALFSGDALMTRDPMFKRPDGPIVFAEHVDRNAEALAALVHLKPYSSAALLPAHGEPMLGEGGVGRAVETAHIA
jgi:glyoxylase-like metal-dependent hydrolase (beta-lactamase superfamily II)